MPVLVFRGLEGWCDRLQVLAHCLAYCKKFNASLCVDWDDGVWGAGEFDFNTCFELEGVKTMTKLQVLKLVATGRMDVRPSCWDLKKMAVHLHNETYKDEYIGEFMKFEIEKAPGDVLVTNGKGDRKWDVRDIVTHLRFKPAVLEGIKTRLKDFDPNSVVIHLRGTDRPDSKGNFTEKAIKAIQHLAIPPHQVYVITDQRDLWEKFSAGFPGCRLANPTTRIMDIPPSSAQGTHQIDPKELRKLGIRKWDMMLDLLADWVALVSAQTAIGREESTYFSMARGLHHIETWPAMFHGWKPHSNSLEEYKKNEAVLLPSGQQAEIQQSSCEYVPGT